MAVVLCRCVSQSRVLKVLVFCGHVFYRLLSCPRKGYGGASLRAVGQGRSSRGSVTRRSSRSSLLSLLSKAIIGGTGAREPEREHARAYDSIREHTSAYESIREQRATPRARVLKLEESSLSRAVSRARSLSAHAQAITHWRNRRLLRPSTPTPHARICRRSKAA